MMCPLRKINLFCFLRGEVILSTFCFVYSFVRYRQLKKYKHRQLKYRHVQKYKHMQLKYKHMQLNNTNTGNLKIQTHATKIKTHATKIQTHAT